MADQKKNAMNQTDQPTGETPQKGNGRVEPWMREAHRFALRVQAYICGHRGAKRMTEALHDLNRDADVLLQLLDDAAHAPQQASAPTPDEVVEQVRKLVRGTALTPFQSDEIVLVARQAMYGNPSAPKDAAPAPTAINTISELEAKLAEVTRDRDLWKREWEILAHG